MKLSKIAVDADAIENGRWVGDLPGLPGVELRVRGFNNADYRNLQTKKLRSITPAQRAGVSLELSDEMTNDLLVETILLDWRGIEDDDGSPLAYSKERAREMLADPRMRRFRDAVLFAADIVGELEVAAIEDDAKN